MIGKGGQAVINDKYYRLAYEFHRRWGPYPATMDDWCMAAHELATICAENNDERLLSNLMIAVYEDLESEYKAAQKRGELTG